MPPCIRDLPFSPWASSFSAWQEICRSFSFQQRCWESGLGALAPAFQTLAVQSAPPSRAGVATSTYFWSLDISVGLAAALLGMAANAFGYPFMYGVICLSSSFLGLVYYFFWRRSLS